MKDGKFEIGDIVTVIGPGPTLNWKWLEQTLGYTGKITGITKEGHCELENGYVYDQESLKLSSSNNPKEASIEYEKLWVGNTKCVKIMKFSNILPRKELPEEYVHHGPSFYFREANDFAFIMQREVKGNAIDTKCIPCGKDCIQWEGENYVFLWRNMIYVDDIIPYDVFIEIVSMMKEAGEYLHQINKKNREEEKKKKWSGTAIQTI